MLTEEDCTRCGACCCNTAANRAEGWDFYVEIDDPKSPLLRRAEWRRRYVAEDPEGNPHLKMVEEGRCSALTGRLGASVRCAVYAHRPRGCRLVTPGSHACELARFERGLGPPPVERVPRR